MKGQRCPKWKKTLYSKSKTKRKRMKRERNEPQLFLPPFTKERKLLFFLMESGVLPVRINNACLPVKSVSKHRINHQTHTTHPHTQHTTTVMVMSGYVYHPLMLCETKGQTGFVQAREGGLRISQTLCESNCVFKQNCWLNEKSKERAT